MKRGYAAKFGERKLWMSVVLCPSSVAKQ